MLALFNNLTKDEVLKFEKLICSAYFNTVGNNKKLFYYLKSKYPRISKEDISGAELSKHIYAEEKPSAEKIWKLKSDFSRVFEEFLIQNELEYGSLDYDLTLLRALKKMGSKKEFELLLKKIKKKRDNQFFRDNNYYLNNVYINDEEYNFRMPAIQFEFPENLQDKNDGLDYFFVFMKLHTFYEMFTHQYNSSKTLNFRRSFLKEIIDFIESNIIMISKDHPNVYVIYLVLMMFVNQNDEKYSMTFKKYLKYNEKNFSKVQLSYYYRYLESYYYLKINEGHINSKDEVFEIYNIMSEKDLFVLDNSITDREFNNVINISLPLGKIDWTERYIEENKDFLHTDLAPETYNLAKAKLFFYKKDFDKIYPCLNLVHYKNPHYYINSKILLAKVFYETGSFESLKSVLDSLRKYTSREKKLSEFQIQSLKSFIKHISFISKIKEGAKAEELAIFKKMIQNEKKFISSRSWFIEKIEEFG